MSIYTTNRQGVESGGRKGVDGNSRRSRFSGNVSRMAIGEVRPRRSVTDADSADRLIRVHVTMPRIPKVVRYLARGAKRFGDAETRPEGKGRFEEMRNGAARFWAGSAWKFWQ